MSAQVNGHQVAKKTRACIQCHDRKVRCDVSNVGTPCTRCAAASNGDSCELMPPPMRSVKRRRIDGQAQNQSAPSVHINPACWAPGPRTYTQPPQHQLVTQDGSACSRSTVNAALPATRQENPQLPLDYDIQRSLQQYTETDTCKESSFQPAQEDDSQLHICRELSQWSVNDASPTRVGRLLQGREVLEYHQGINSVTILGEVFSPNRPKRLGKIILENTPSDPGQYTEASSLDDAYMQVLQNKGAFTLPPRNTCDKMLRIFFDCVYPYIPIINKIDFLEDYQRGTYSAFLTQCILASMVSYAPLELINEAGYQDHFSAQKSFFDKAQLLCDLGAETSQLRLLQGSIALSLLHFSFALDKDYRYWLSNAVRIATVMGLHKNTVLLDLNPPTRRLFCRLWWLLYNRDCLTVTIGIDNVRRIHDDDFDISDVTEADWTRETIPQRFVHIVRPTTRLQRLFFMENCKLSRLSSQFLAVSRAKTPEESKLACENVQTALTSWRRALPDCLQVGSHDEFNIDNFWVLILHARSYLISCLAWRTLLIGLSRSVNLELRESTSRKLSGVKFELGAVIDRLMIHNVTQYCPLAITTCASTLLALYIEAALKPAPVDGAGLLAQTQIHLVMKFLRCFYPSWNSLKWTLRLFEVVISRTGLSLVSTGGPIYDVKSTNPFRTNTTAATDYVVGGSINTNNLDHEIEKDILGGDTAPSHGLSRILVPESDEVPSFVMGFPAEGWLQDLLDVNFSELNTESMA